MELKHLMAVSLIAGLLGVASVQASPADEVLRFLNAIRNDDLQTIYQMMESNRLELENIKSRFPEAMWDKKFEEHYRSWEESYWGDTEFRSYLLRDPELSVLETRDDGARKIVYVQCRYSDWSSAPLVAVEGQGRMYLHEEGEKYQDGVSFLRPLRGVILEVTVSAESGTVRAAQFVPDSESYWEDHPPILMSLQWHASWQYMAYDPGGFQWKERGWLLSYRPVGQGPFTVKTQCNGRNLDEFMELRQEWGSKQRYIYHLFGDMKLGTLEPLPSPLELPAECFVTLTDAQGRAESRRWVITRGRELFCRAWPEDGSENRLPFDCTESTDAGKHFAVNPGSIPQLTTRAQQEPPSEVQASQSGEVPSSDDQMVYVGESRMGSEVWPFTLRLTRDDSGRVEGEIEWPTEDSVHRVEGAFEGVNLVFKEVGYIRRGKATIGAKYALSPTWDGGMQGKWKFMTYKGTISLKPTE